MFGSCHVGFFFYIQKFLKCLFLLGRVGYLNVVHMLKIGVSNDIKVSILTIEDQRHICHYSEIRLIILYFGI